jgi:hypothetical protein
MTNMSGVDQHTNRNPLKPIHGTMLILMHQRRLQLHPRLVSLLLILMTFSFHQIMSFLTLIHYQTFLLIPHIIILFHTICPDSNTYIPVNRAYLSQPPFTPPPPHNNFSSYNNPDFVPPMLHSSPHTLNNNVPPTSYLHFQQQKDHFEHH